MTDTILAPILQTGAVGAIAVSAVAALWKIAGKYLGSMESTIALARTDMAEVRKNCVEFQTGAIAALNGINGNISSMKESVDQAVENQRENIHLTRDLAQTVSLVVEESKRDRESRGSA